jgi:hypothetical protein
MKNVNYLVLCAVALGLAACNFSAGTKKDFGTGLSYSYNGFTVDQVLLAGPDNLAMSDNEVVLNSEIAIVAQGLANYQMKDDKVFPGLMLSVTDKAGTEVLGAKDLFSDTEGYSAVDASVLRGTVTVGDPMKTGETYHVKMRIWDKIKTDNELTVDVDLVVK